VLFAALIISSGEHHLDAEALAVLAANRDVKPDRTLSLRRRIFSLVRGIPLRRTGKKRTP
jgi:hypothetical protein